MSLGQDRPVPPGAVMVARVVPDVTGLDKHFDYRVPDSLRDVVRPGALVRVTLNGRRVGGWVLDVGSPDGSIAVDKLLPLTKWSGFGPAPDVIELGRWAAVRWGVNRLRPFMVVASPPTMVTALPRRVERRVEPGVESGVESGVERSAGQTVLADGVHRIPPNTDPLPLLLRAAAAGPLLVIHPAQAAARAIAARLRKTGLAVALVPEQWQRAAGGVDVVVGTRSAAWAPCPEMAAVVVLDEHDESLQEERSPTWHARDVVVERARRAGAICLLVSPSPSVTALEWAGRRVVSLAAGDERDSWPILQIVDRTEEEPWKRSLITSDLIRYLRDETCKVVCVLNTVGRARLLACRSCRALQRCERCDAAVVQHDDRSLVCRRCATVRPAVCQQCGSAALANVRPGVTRVREELQAAAARPVVAVTAAASSIDPANVYVGTEAVLHRVRNADIVAFLDLDAELLAPRYRAAEQTMALLIRAARLVGPRSSGGRILVQTFVPRHEVLQAVLHADPARLAAAETARRRLLGLPPFKALAEIKGIGAGVFAAATGLETTVGSADVDVALVRADTWMELGESLVSTPRPASSRLRIAVDPPRR